MAGAEIFIRVEEGDLKSLRDHGRFTSEGVRALRERNERFATSMQADVVRRMRNHIAFGGRAGVSTGRLLRVTADKRNVFSDQWSIGVGRPDWLDNSVARYWRTFEEGSAAVWKHPFVGTQLRGMFGGTIIGYAHTRTPGPQPQPLAGGPWGARGGKLRWYWSMPLNENFRVKREIQPAHIYRDVGREAHLDEYGVQNAIKLFDSVFGAGLNPPAPASGFRLPRL